MTTSADHGFPVRRPGFISAAQFVGEVDRLDLELVYTDLQGAIQTLALPLTRNPDDPDDKGVLCLPSSKTINDLNETALIAHLRMATLISGAIPGSTEWQDAFVEGTSNNLQCAIGSVKVLGLTQVDDTVLTVSLQKGAGAVRVIPTDYGELGTYSFAPETQLLVVPGAIEAQYPTYVHDPAHGSVLTEAQKANIIQYVLSLAIWI